MSSGASVVLVAVEVDADAPLAADRLGCMAGVERADGRRDLRHLLAEPGPERAEVGLDLVGDQLGLARRRTPAPSRSAPSGPGRPSTRSPRARRPGRRSPPRQRLAHLDAGLPSAPLGPARPPGAPPPCGPRGRRRGAPRRARGSRPGGPSRGPRGPARLPWISSAQEGDERGEQLRHLEEAVAQGREGGAVALPEAAARQAHVPVGELVDVRGDRPPGGWCSHSRPCAR